VSQAGKDSIFAILVFSSEQNSKQSSTVSVREMKGLHCIRISSLMHRLSAYIILSGLLVLIFYLLPALCPDMSIVVKIPVSMESADPQTATRDE